MNALTATAARNGDPTASMPKMISETPHKMDNVEPAARYQTEFAAP